jgi:hypothetical protein
MEAGIVCLAHSLYRSMLFPAVSIPLTIDALKLLHWRDKEGEAHPITLPHGMVRTSSSGTLDTEEKRRH